MLSVTNLLRVLKYDDLLYQNIIPALYDKNTINSNYHPLDVVKKYSMNIYCFLGYYVEAAIIQRLDNITTDYNTLFKDMNPGYNLKLINIWPTHKQSLDNTVQYLLQHLNYCNTPILHVSAKECNIYHIKGKIDLYYDNHIVEIKATKLIEHKIKKAIVQCLIYSTIQRLHGYNIEYISLLYPLQEVVLTYDIRYWNSSKLAIRLLTLNNVYQL